MLVELADEGRAGLAGAEAELGLASGKAAAGAFEDRRLRRSPVPGFAAASAAPRAAAASPAARRSRRLVLEGALIADSGAVAVAVDRPRRAEEVGWEPAGRRVAGVDGGRAGRQGEVALKRGSASMLPVLKSAVPPASRPFDGRFE